MPASGSYLPDESSSPSIDTDPEGMRYWGTDAAILAGPQASGLQDAILMGNLTYAKGEVMDAYQRSSAPGEYQLTKEPAPKYADELMENLDYTLAPTPGMLDGDKGAVLTQGYDPYLTKEPKLRGNEQPSTGSIAANTASSPAASLPNTEAQLMQLLFGM